MKVYEVMADRGGEYGADSDSHWTTAGRAKEHAITEWAKDPGDRADVSTAHWRELGREWWRLEAFHVPPLDYPHPTCSRVRDRAPGAVRDTGWMVSGIEVQE
jgi:hypothetical protein